MWFNIMIVGGAVMSGAVTMLPVLEPLLTVTAYKVLFFVFGLMNIWLRKITVSGIVGHVK